MSTDPMKPQEMPPQVSTNSEDRMWALLAHISLIVFFVFGPLIIWLVKKETSPFVADQAKEALNFQLAVLIVLVVTGITCLIPLVVWVGAVVYSIIAAIEANKGVAYRYPYTFRMIS